MKRYMKQFVICMLALCMGILFSQCEKDQLVIEGATPTSEGNLPVVSTNNVTNITSSSAICGGYVSSDGGLAITARGVCWGTSPNNLSINGLHTTNGTGTGSFTSQMTGLQAGISYYVCAYATNSKGTSYGDKLKFTTKSTNQRPSGDGLCGTVTDYDGNSYDIVKLGNQVWMAENLRTTHYANGTSIPVGSYGSTTTAYRYYPNNNSGNVAQYGYLYNWKAVMRNSSSSSSNPSRVQGICPNGWHVPSIVEWSELTGYIDNNAYYTQKSGSVSKALAGTTSWSASSVTDAPGYRLVNNNSTNFGALPAGYSQGTNYYGFGENAKFWSATEDYNNSSTFAYICSLLYNYAYVSESCDYKIDGHSVRCLRD